MVHKSKRKEKEKRKTFSPSLSPSSLICASTLSLSLSMRTQAIVLPVNAHRYSIRKFAPTFHSSSFMGMCRYASVTSNCLFVRLRLTDRPCQAQLLACHRLDTLDLCVCVRRETRREATADTASPFLSLVDRRICTSLVRTADDNVSMPSQQMIHLRSYSTDRVNSNSAR